MRPVWPLAQFLGQLDALRFAARKRGGRLAQVHVAQPDVVQRLQLGADLRNVLQQRQRLFHGRFQQVGDGIALVLHLQGFVIVAAAAADVAGDVDIGQEIHLDALQPVALAGFAAPALHVEAEAAGLVAALARFRQHGVEIANGREQPGVGGGIRARRAADGRLIDSITLSMMLDALDGSRARRARRASRRSRCASARYRISFTSVDLPLPETPVTTISRPSGNSTSMSLQIVLGARR